MKTAPKNRHRLDRRAREDDLLYCHRLLKMRVPMRTIAEKTGLPLKSVEHVQRTNWYEANWS
jgi:hypothetical protein